MANKELSIQNPALQFLSMEEESASSVKSGMDLKEARENAPEGYIVNPLYIEAKTRRVQLVFQPSLYQRLKNRAVSEKISVNELVHKILKAYLDEE